jgi:hypothetical protein
VVRFFISHQKRTKLKQKLRQLSQKWAGIALRLPDTMPASDFGKRLNRGNG